MTLDNREDPDRVVAQAAKSGTDVFTTAKRSAVMGAIRGSGNKSTELRMIDLFRKHRITGWRRHMPLTGKPDFTFRKERVVVFVDGCFWHGCPKPKHSPMPKNRAEWWAAKLSRNKQRDQSVACTLREKGWNVLRVWECDLAGDAAGVKDRILSVLHASRTA